MAGIDEQLTKYLADAHSIEVQALAQLKRAPAIAGDDAIAAAFREHLAETERHERLIRELLEQRGESPSRVKDTVMAVGGAGFLLFARMQPDTPGKLCAHALSYEALELASYELLARVATRAGETAVADTATTIRDDERAMMQRLESLFDASVDASLRQHPRDDLRELVRKYLADAHALEEQAAQLLARAPKLVEERELARVFDEHLAETRVHAQRVEQRLDAVGGAPSSLKDALMRLGARSWGGFFQGHPDTPGKLTAFAYAFEHLEVGGYEQLSRVAALAGDADTAAVAGRILAEERAAAGKLAGAFHLAAEASLQAVGAA